MTEQRFDQNGFSAAELLITLFIAALFLITGYQLYAYVARDGADSAQAARASTVAYQYLNSTAADKTYTKKPCSASSQPSTVTLDASSKLNGGSVSTVVSCPYSTAPLSNITLVTTTVTYNGPSGQETVRRALYTK